MLPAAMALEWMSAALERRGLPPERRAIYELRVLRGARLLRFNEGERFSLFLQGEGGRLRCELRGEGGALHYNAAAGEAPPTEDAERPGFGPDEDVAGYTRAEIYGQWLFHGPAFQAIQGTARVGARRAEARLAGVRAQRWPGSYASDPLAVDGALQLAQLWGIWLWGRMPLPTSVGAFLPRRPGPAAGLLRCELAGRSHTDSRCVCDARLYDGQGLWAELRGVEMHAL